MGEEYVASSRTVHCLQCEKGGSLRRRCHSCRLAVGSGRVVQGAARSLVRPRALFSLDAV